MEIDQDDELRVYVNILLDKEVGWAAKWLAGRAVAAIAQSWMQRIERDARRDIKGPSGDLVRQFELYERALQAWQNYTETSDRSTLRGELGDIVAGLESLLPQGDTKPGT